MSADLSRSVPTPWGWADKVQAVAEGIDIVTTPSHGGFRVSEHRLSRIPMAWRVVSFAGRGELGWFEEDVDWCMVALNFPEFFDRRSIADARRTFDAWIKPKLKPREVV